MAQRSALDRHIYDERLSKEELIRKARINRTTFFTGLKYPLVFTDEQRKRLAKALKMDLVEFEQLIAK